MPSFTTKHTPRSGVLNIRDKLEQAREACRKIDQPELAEKLQEAVDALDQADMKTYRRRVETVVSKLGHIR